MGTSQILAIGHKEISVIISKGISKEDSVEIEACSTETGETSVECGERLVMAFAKTGSRIFGNRRGLQELSSLEEEEVVKDDPMVEHHKLHPLFAFCKGRRNVSTAERADTSNVNVHNPSRITKFKRRTRKAPQGVSRRD